MDHFSSLFHELPNFILVAVATLTLIFVVYFFRKYQANKIGLDLAIQGLKAKLGEHNGRDPSELNPLFAKEPLLHIWNEYSDTLHPMRLALSGKAPIVEYRSSMPAEMMFTKESLVDGPLFDDFWRHLPGILTGLGIIGTFAGLLHGLSDSSLAMKPVSMVSSIVLTCAVLPAALFSMTSRTRCIGSAIDSAMLRPTVSPMC